MNDLDAIRGVYFRSSRELLRHCPEKREIFEELWEANELKRAYVLVTKTVEQLKITRSAENLKADEDFFWACVH